MKSLEVNNMLKQNKELAFKLHDHFFVTPINTLWNISEIESENRYWLKGFDVNELGEHYGIIVDNQYIEDNFELL